MSTVGARTKHRNAGIYESHLIATQGSLLRANKNLRLQSTELPQRSAGLVRKPESLLWS